MSTIKLSQKRKESIVRSLLKRERQQPNIERSFLCPSKETYHGRSPFIPSQTMLKQAKGDFS